ncbi:hypothetical protein D918_09557 [Trichuris suis]|nr:hypothetical protein D918_09557 [Trichuris suis]
MDKSTAFVVPVVADGLLSKAAVERSPMEMLCTLEITDFEPDVIQELVRFMYSGHCNRIDELGADLLTAADKYNLEDLKFHCEKALVRAINVRNVCELLVLADSHMAASLYRGCMDYMRKNVNVVTDTAGWQTIIRDYPELIY